MSGITNADFAEARLDWLRHRIDAVAVSRLVDKGCSGRDAKDAVERIRLGENYAGQMSAFKQKLARQLADDKIRNRKFL